MHVTGLSSNGPRNLYTLHDPDLPGVKVPGFEGLPLRMLSVRAFGGRWAGTLFRSHSAE
ncbi:hypothetical protein CROQUDRAFT_100151 [Cronartium quercuum f. sp. fusiforme G11]|uniref:Uncharacterized protein n=1 Tax=Cronartium quercuum f. sp. fusiforme G11 TaxID=708437 RepID=A0A9P6T5Y1_9BASI|nr:hypothetical protein CROQUDRAFT_100151 [Cronartium quercuum f. sp. fusiforme G11]